MRKQWKQWLILYLGAPNSLQMVTAAMKLKDLLFGRKTMTNLDSILKRRDIISPTKAYIVKATVFPVLMYGGESWTIRKAECWKIDTFELWCWRRLLRVPWLQGDQTSSSLGKSALNILWKDWYWRWSSNILSPWCDEPTHWERLWCWERLKAEEGDDRE